MSIYTKSGDEGMTSLINETSVSKADDRIELLGTIDELNSYIGFAKIIADNSLQAELSQIQRDLILIMSGVADTANSNYTIYEEKIKNLERRIDEIEISFFRKKEFFLYGECEESSRLDLARAVARRAERYFVKVKSHHKVDTNATRYMNRLSDYLYILARFEDQKNAPEKNKKLVDN